jgi:sorbitol-specific phosphotransferase system component IIBC
VKAAKSGFSTTRTFRRAAFFFGHNGQSNFCPPYSSSGNSTTRRRLTGMSTVCSMNMVQVYCDLFQKGRAENGCRVSAFITASITRIGTDKHRLSGVRCEKSTLIRLIRAICGLPWLKPVIKPCGILFRVVLVLQ